MPAEFDPDAILKTLRSHSVDFVVIGGYAAYVQGSPLLTEDVDVVPSPDSSNFERLSDALTELGAKIRADGKAFKFGHSGESLAAGQIWNLTTRYGDLDITQTPSGTFGYDDLIVDSIPVKLGRIEIRIASLQDIVRSKEAAGRDKDRRALPILRELVAQGLLTRRKR